MRGELLHYTECGLPNVYLRNGYERHSTPYGDAISIHDIDGLHNAIGLHLVNDKSHLTGLEIRFLRKELDLPQASLAACLGVSENTVRGWEKGRTNITPPADRVLRALYREHVAGDGSIRALIDRIAQLNRDMREHDIEFEESSEGWKAAA